VLAAAGDVRNRAAMLREAVQLLERCGDRLELARALSDLSQVHRESGELGEARLLLRRAKQELKACQAVVPAPRSPQSPAAQSREAAPAAASAAEAADVAVLSEAERNVAALAALGHTNREIGRTLYITVSTVEQHLTRVYRKLNVARRTELPAKLAQHDIAVPGAAERRALVS
jgi:DNA-binding CsgD family transcriptional regulator